jgi:phosphoglycerate dehydrogenase-like enzyme
LAVWGDEWRRRAPQLEYVTLQRGRRLDDGDVARIDMAVFSSDLWTEHRGAAFMKVLLDAPNARWLHMFSAGLDNPVFSVLRERGLTITHSAGSSATPIAHTVIMQVIALCRDARAFAIGQARHEWLDREVDDVEGRRMGIVGLGGIGSEVARLAVHFGIDVVGLRRTPRGDEPCVTWEASRLHELLPTLDDLVLTAPLNDDTRNIIGATELALLPEGAHVVNVGRGQLIDESALVEALVSGHVGGAALDVFVDEPLPTEHPLWDLPNVIVTPHSSGATPLAAQRAAAVFHDNLDRWLNDRPLRNVG